MTLFELAILGTLALATLNAIYWVFSKLEGFDYLSDDEIEKRIKEANDALENRPRVRAITKE
jgi:hypothetical protein